eukprot:6573365-Alexandrium_andersonii.AAC.1
MSSVGDEWADRRPKSEWRTKFVRNDCVEVLDAFGRVSAATRAPTDVEKYSAAVFAFESTMTLLHPSRNAHPDAPEAMRVLYSM